MAEVETTASNAMLPSTSSSYRSVTLEAQAALVSGGLSGNESPILDNNLGSHHCRDPCRESHTHCMSQHIFSEFRDVAGGVALQPPTLPEKTLSHLSCRPLPEVTLVDVQAKTDRATTTRGVAATLSRVTLPATEDNNNLRPILKI